MTDRTEVAEMNDDAGVRESEAWLDAASQEEDEVEVEEYDIVSSPNDWNFSTIVSFIESGAMKIPSFQRNYIWDRKRASKLIESLLIGLPVPQVFLYEESRNNFLVIDGQQRLLTLYFFSKGRFPKPKIRGELRKSLQRGFLDEDLLEDNDYFEPFKLSLPKSATGIPNRFNGLTYKGLKEDRTSLDLRTIRNIVVKQTSPEGNSAVFELFSRLNTGSVNLTPQEIRASLYHSDFFTKVIELNSDSTWRQIIGTQNPDPRMRDTEFLLRALSLADSSDGYSGSMANFINNYCLRAKKFTDTEAQEVLKQLSAFFSLFDDVDSPFMRTGKFSGVLFESAYAAWQSIGRPMADHQALSAAINQAKLTEEFAETLQEGSTKPLNTRKRIGLLRTYIEASV
ncbi:DUF262 domain-containing protein [Paeniglutamicibacter gangotriensis]|uniref:GmrSD restriction endonucleases N-terminal domain-containing protein n=1 Tax=Paeniglutamicibacter gangotriensis Lz1y TaxID=1276920 RepID=M7MVH5_9MICC|nr:DUF262 domain-containing protein [Paeniglutamicibacter gangotriensis]EMR00443.1 hypothetical protein ADIAG_00450 [Paeniglutamicibacter gangotriensis Lz1y]